MGGKPSPEVNRRAQHAYYLRNRAAIRAKRNEKARQQKRDKDRTTPNERARAKLRYAVWSGKIQKPSCCDKCGSKGQINGHHHDYTKPLSVEWLCNACHGRAHAK